MTAITFKEAWRKFDRNLERDATEFWRASGKRLPANVQPEERARELCAVAYRDERPVGVSTATLEMVPQFRCRMAVYRCSVTIGLRRTPLSWRITEYSQVVLERWSLEHPDEKVMGLYAVMQSRELVTRYPQVFGVANMLFAGFTPVGFPIRVCWFKHATIPVDWPPRPSRPVAPPQPAQPEPAVKARWGGQITVGHSHER